MKNFSSEFKTLDYVIRNSAKILLVAHNHPDADTTGSVFALREYFTGLGKSIDTACFDSFPEYLKKIIENEKFVPLDKVILENYDLIIACDSVERGFKEISTSISGDQVTALIDHHPDITIKGDINIIDSSFSSVCEIVLRFLEFSKANISKKIATYLLMGILGDTGTFQHANTTPEVMEAASRLMKKGAPLSKIVEATFSSKKISTLKLWGRAFEKARINPANGMIATVLTKKDLAECDAIPEDISQVAGILNSVPGTKFALVLSERDGNRVKGSLRSEEYKGVDVSQIAARFGGGGHKLASGFDIKGHVIETESGWEIV